MKRNMYFIMCAALTVSCSFIEAGALSLVNSERFSGGSIKSVNWHTSGSTNYIVYGGNNGDEKNIRIAKFDLEDSELDVKKEAKYSDDDGTYVNAVAWTYSGPRRIAVGGNKNDEGHEIVVYDYDDGDLDKTDSADMPLVNAFDWLRFNNISYLAVGGFNHKEGQEVRVYSYINDELLLLSNATSEYFHGEANSVKWLVNGSNIYLATGGFELGQSSDTNVRIYSFNPIAQTLTLVTSMPFDFDYVYSVAWLFDGTNMFLAATGHDGANNEQIRVYSFNGTALTLLDSVSFNHGSVLSSDWLTFDETFYLAVCGDDGAANQEVTVYSFNGTTLTLVTSVALAAEDVSSLQWKIIDGAAYLAVGTSLSETALLLYKFIPTIG